VILTINPAAIDELTQAARHYKLEAGAALANAFLNEYERILKLIVDFPDMGSPTAQGHRRYVMKRFPYSVHYIKRQAEIQVYAISHHSRRPHYWRGRTE
jgi:plasmid stabilization system protein ParE